MARQAEMTVVFRIRSFVADVILVVSQSLARWAERLDHLRIWIDPYPRTG